MRIVYHFLAFGRTSIDLPLGVSCDCLLIFYQCFLFRPDFSKGLFIIKGRSKIIIKTYLRGDSGFSSPKLYKTCEMNGCSYAIRLKQNSPLTALASDKDEGLYKAAKEGQTRYAVTYGEFMYQAGSWEYPRRVVFKIEKPYGRLAHMYTFLVTNMDMEPYQIIQFYCGRGRMENFIFWH